MLLELQLGSEIIVFERMTVNNIWSPIKKRDTPEREKMGSMIFVVTMEVKGAETKSK